MKKVLIFTILFLVAIIFAISGFFLFKKKSPAEVSLTDRELKKEIGQMIMVGFRGTEAPESSEIYEIIKNVKIGGVILFDYDIPTKIFSRNIKNSEQTKKLILDIQKYSEIPLFVSVDAEGGNVNRLKEEYGFLQIASAQKMGDDKTLKVTQEESGKLAIELKNLGFNMNLAPVVDLNINPKNPIIGFLGRAFSVNANEVVENAIIFIKNHLSNDIIPVEKHFPGQGSAMKDTHLGVADITETYKQEELLPYKKLNDLGLLDVVMVAHTINKKIDIKYPATLSKKFLKDILRNEVGFDGVIMSDDMQMSAITGSFGFTEAIVTSINAGTDIIVVSNNVSSGYDKNLAYKVESAIFNAVKSGIISKERIQESYNRIIKLKQKFKLIQKTPTNRVCFNSKCFSVELATTNAERGKGLMFREKLDKNNGMMFIFDTPSVYPFWMQNTLIPLDIIWIGEDKKVVFIGENIQPCKKIICPSINPQVKAKYVLEINASLSKEFDIKIGDSINF